jgi:hypothetical protein
LRHAPKVDGKRKNAKDFGQSGITIFLQTFDLPLTTFFRRRVD